MTDYIGKILIVDDDKFFCDIKAALLQDNNYIADTIQSADLVLDKLSTAQYDLVLLDLRIGKKSGIDTLKEIKQFDPNIEIIMITGFETFPSAVQSIQLGAYDYLPKKISDEELLFKINRALEKRRNSIEILTLKDALTKHFGFSNVIGKNKQMQKIYDTIKIVCNTEAAVLIRGETGTGKELIAKSIHFNSKRKENPFIAVNCAAISEYLMASELFGHEKGAFTDAYKQRIGKIEEANNGTLFLDEIGDMSLNLQANLLRFLQEKNFERVGSNITLSSDVRIISATNRDLNQMIDEGKFREDLYYRINVISIEVPPLRKRIDDLPLLINHFIEQADIKFNKSIKGISKESIKRFKNYTWPGNIRELENIIIRAVLTTEGDTIDVETISDYFQPQIIPDLEFKPNLKLSLQEARDIFESNYLLGLLKIYHGNLKMVTEKSGMDRKSISLKMQKYGFKKEDFKKIPE